MACMGGEWAGLSGQEQWKNCPPFTADAGGESAEASPTTEHISKRTGKPVRVI